jgi:hypothetical protein
MGRLCQLADNPEVKAATGATDALTLFATFPQDIIWRVPDSSLVDFALTFAANLGQIPDSACVALYPRPGSPPWSQRFMVIAQGADSAVSVRWADFLESWVWATIRHSPRQPVASPAEALANIMAHSNALSADDRKTMIALGRRETVPDGVACHAIQSFFAMSVRGPTSRAAATFRALMQGMVPWNVAT